MKTNLLLLSVLAFTFNSFASDMAIDRKQDLFLEAQKWDKEAASQKDDVGKIQKSNNSKYSSTKTYVIEEVYGDKPIKYTQTVNLQENLNHYELSRLNIKSALARIYNIPLDTEEKKQKWSDLVDQTYFDADAIITQAEVDGLDKSEVPKFYFLVNQLLNETLQKEVSYSMRPLNIDLEAFKDHMKLALPQFRELHKNHIKTFHMKQIEPLPNSLENYLSERALNKLENSSCEELNRWKAKAENISYKTPALETLEVAIDKTLDDKECLQAE
ncbi:MAG: hypothetical protein VX642_02820 [Bdellovibrionota bacterium]|nr:hypothetical protein [Bdellovibrionota bacterium]